MQYLGAVAPAYRQGRVLEASVMRCGSDSPCPENICHASRS